MSFGKEAKTLHIADIASETVFNVISVTFPLISDCFVRGFENEGMSYKQYTMASVVFRSQRTTLEKSLADTSPQDKGHLRLYFMCNVLSVQHFLAACLISPLYSCV